MLRPRRDVVVIQPIDTHNGINSHLKRYDVILFETSKGYILHRIIDIKDNIYITTRGDNSHLVEKITTNQVIGLMSGFFRKNTFVKTSTMFYRLYSRIIVSLNLIITYKTKWCNHSHNSE